MGVCKEIKFFRVMEIFVSLKFDLKRFDTVTETVVSKIEEKMEV